MNDEELRKLVEEDLLYDLISIKISNNLETSKMKRHEEEKEISKTGEVISNRVSRYIDKTKIEPKELKTRLLARAKEQYDAEIISKRHYEYLTFFIEDSIPELEEMEIE